MSEFVFFYGTLMTEFDRRRRAGIEEMLSYVGRGSIAGALFDLGIYPAAVPAPDGVVWGEVYRMGDSAQVLSAIDGIEGSSQTDTDRSLYLRKLTEVTFEDGTGARAWVYFYNAPLGGAQRIASGDYLDHVRVR